MSGIISAPRQAPQLANTRDPVGLILEKAELSLSSVTFHSRPLHSHCVFMRMFAGHFGVGV